MLKYDDQITLFSVNHMTCTFKTVIIQLE